MGLGFGITGNESFDWFIVQSRENVEKVLDLFSKSGEKYINNILIHLKLDSRDFTDSDWKIISQYLGDEEDDW